MLKLCQHYLPMPTTEEGCKMIAEMFWHQNCMLAIWCYSWSRLPMGIPRHTGTHSHQRRVLDDQRLCPWPQLYGDAPLILLCWKVFFLSRQNWRMGRPVWIS